MTEGRRISELHNFSDASASSMLIDIDSVNRFISEDKISHQILLA